MTGDPIPALRFSNEEIAGAILPRFPKSAIAEDARALALAALEETERLANAQGHVDPAALCGALRARLGRLSPRRATFVREFYDLHTLFLIVNTDLCRVSVADKLHATTVWGSLLLDDPPRW